jgi:hypothetical protein
MIIEVAGIRYQASGKPSSLSPFSYGSNGVRVNYNKKVVPELLVMDHQEGNPIDLNIGKI